MRTLSWLWVVCLITLCSSEDFDSAPDSLLEDELGDGVTDLYSDFDVDAELEELNGFINSIDTLSETLEEYMGTDECCTHTCNDGSEPTPRKGHIPSTNGCGTNELEVDVSSIPGATECCNEHDRCYDTCNRKKTTCDDEFKTCLDKACVKISYKVESTEGDVKACEVAGKMMYVGTLGLGCKAYMDAQREACICRDDLKSIREKSHDEL